MLPLKLPAAGDRLSVLCLGAHSDDIEIGAGAALLKWIATGVKLNVLWCVLSGIGDREGEARKSAESFQEGVDASRVEVTTFRDGFFPTEGEQIKGWFEA